MRGLSLRTGRRVIACPYRYLTGRWLWLHGGAGSSSLIKKMMACGHLGICFAHHIWWRWHLGVWSVLACFKTFADCCQLAHARNPGGRNSWRAWIHNSTGVNRTWLCRWLIFYSTASSWCWSLQRIPTLGTCRAGLRWINDLFLRWLRLECLRWLINMCLLSGLVLNECFCLEHLRLCDLWTLLILQVTKFLCGHDFRTSWFTVEIIRTCKPWARRVNSLRLDAEFLLFTRTPLQQCC